MCKLILSVTIVSVFAASARALFGPCGNPYQTTDRQGNPDTAASIGTYCQAVANQPSGTCTTPAAGSLTPAVDAVCQYSVFQSSFRICCYSVTAVSFATPGPGSTFSTNAPGTTNSPQTLRPTCPNGALTMNSANTNQPMQCNLTNLLNQNCPYGYTCKKAANVVDVYGTLTNPTDDLGAAFTPNVCCKTTTLNSYSAVFTEAGLTPTYCPTAPLAGIVSFMLTDNAARTMTSLGNDVSYISDRLKIAPTTLYLYTTTSSTTFYHVLMFDSTNNKDCVFSVNNKGSGTNMLTVVYGTTTPITLASVYNAGPITSPVYTYSRSYMPPLYNTAAHRIVILVWQTLATLTFAGPGVKSTTQLNLSPGLYGDFEPGRVPGSAGAFTTVSALLNGKLSSILGQPIAGTYFFAKK